MIGIHIYKTTIVITGLTFDVDASDHAVAGASDLLEPFREEIGTKAFDFQWDELGVPYVGMMERDADVAFVLSNLTYPRPAWFD